MPALRGPARSSQPPHTAAEQPSSTKNRMYVTVMLEIRQSQLLVKSSAAKLIIGRTGQRRGAGPSDLDSGSQNTEKP